KTPYDLQKRARECLGAAIAEDVTQAFVTITTIYNEGNADRLRFIPMPRRPKHPAVERSFFIPVSRIDKAGQLQTTFELFLLVREKKCIAYRYEIAHSPPTVHDYDHVQMSQKMLRQTIPTAVEPWIPVRYPAFPLLTTGSLKMFLVMVTAIHGYSGGVLSILQEIFQKAGRANETILYVKELKSMLG